MNERDDPGPAESNAEDGREERSTEDVQEAALGRQHERAEHAESVLATVREDLGSQSYPVSSEDLATEYADQAIDLPNETETLGSVFDRLDDTYEDPRDAFAALVEVVLPDETLTPEGEDLVAGTPRWDEETFDPDETPEQEARPEDESMTTGEDVAVVEDEDVAVAEDDEAAVVEDEDVAGTENETGTEDSS